MQFHLAPPRGLMLAVARRRDNLSMEQWVWSHWSMIMPVGAEKWSIQRRVALLRQIETCECLTPGPVDGYLQKYAGMGRTFPYIAMTDDEVVWAMRRWLRYSMPQYLIVLNALQDEWKMTPRIVKRIMARDWGTTGLREAKAEVVRHVLERCLPFDVAFRDRTVDGARVIAPDRPMAQILAAHIFRGTKLLAVTPRKGGWNDLP